MKTRVVENLRAFSQDSVPEKFLPMFLTLCEETALSEEVLKTRSKKILHHLLHNYASFSIETIDSFNHRLIRTFSKDLKLNAAFEVELNTDYLLQKAVDRLIAKTGKETDLTAVLIEFALQKTNEDKSWDISYDFNEIGKLLFKENDRPHLKKLEGKTLQDFIALKKNIQSQKQILKSNIVKQAIQALEAIANLGIEHDNFSGGKRAYLPNYFKKLKVEDFSVTFDKKWQETLSEKPFYPAKTDDSIKQLIDSVAPLLMEAFYNTKESVLRFQFINAISKNLTSLSVLNAIQQEIEILKTEESILPISEFNSLIYNQIKGEPAPFIYERLGEKYQHFFIDEFQDTSGMQWQNLIPLIDNALSQENERGERGSLLLVGDAKQSIYRWRGGEPEQFMDLNHSENPFSISDKKVYSLDTNYRSYDEVVRFNNSFFEFIASHFQEQTHHDLYQNTTGQNSTSKGEGFVNIEFIEAENKEAENKIYPERVLEIIKSLMQQGYSESDICILIRKKKEGIVISEFLAQNKVSVVSAETLLIKENPLVVCLINSLNLLINFNNNTAKVNLLGFLHGHLKIQAELHEFLNATVFLSEESFALLLQKHQCFWETEYLKSLSLYETCEALVRAFSLEPIADAYLQTFLDTVFEFSLKPDNHISHFLEYWEAQKEKISISPPKGSKAVQLMTIHKAKGLEFPVVIFPYADVDLYKEVNPKTWYPLSKEDFNGFEEALLPFNKGIEVFGEVGETIFNQRRARQELDNINLLYVVLTRAVEQLYIVSKKQAKENIGTYSGLFTSYLKTQELWHEEKSSYSFGSMIKVSKKSPENRTETFSFISSDKISQNISLATNTAWMWDSSKGEALSKGLVIHDIMAQIKTGKDLDKALQYALFNGMINQEQAPQVKEQLLKLVNHPMLSLYFKEGSHVLNESDIFTKDQKILRPDRLNFMSPDLVHIIDYKTGEKQEEHKYQLLKYQSALEDMNYKVEKRLLVYIDEQIEVVQS